MFTTKKNYFILVFLVMIPYIKTSKCNKNYNKKKIKILLKQVHKKRKLNFCMTLALRAIL